MFGYTLIEHSDNYLVESCLISHMLQDFPSDAFGQHVLPLWNPNVHLRLHKRALERMQSHFNSVNNFRNYFSTIHFNIFISPIPASYK
jgi:hypothetical protein